MSVLLNFNFINPGLACKKPHKMCFSLVYLHGHLTVDKTNSYRQWVLTGSSAESVFQQLGCETQFHCKYCGYMHLPWYICNLAALWRNVTKRSITAKKMTQNENEGISSFLTAFIIIPLLIYVKFKLNHFSSVFVFSSKSTPSIHSLNAASSYVQGVPL